MSEDERKKALCVKIWNGKKEKDRPRKTDTPTGRIILCKGKREQWETSDRTQTPEEEEENKNWRKRSRCMVSLITLERENHQEETN